VFGIQGSYTDDCVNFPVAELFSFINYLGPFADAFAMKQFMNPANRLFQFPSGFQQ
jgi:hypothetical protein